MSKKEIFKSLLLGCLVMATFVFGSFKANAEVVDFSFSVATKKVSQENISHFRN